MHSPRDQGIFSSTSSSILNKMSFTSSISNSSEESQKGSLRYPVFGIVEGIWSKSVM